RHLPVDASVASGTHPRLPPLSRAPIRMPASRSTLQPRSILARWRSDRSMTSDDATVPQHDVSAVTCDDDPSYLDHIRGAAENASRDYDSLVAKLSTAGLGVCVGVAGIAKGNSSWLGVAAGMFALAAVAALLAHRLSADRLLRLAN